MKNRKRVWNKLNIPNKEDLTKDRMTLSEKEVINKYQVSKACIHRWYNILHIPKKPITRNQEKIICKTCGKEFLADKYLHRKYCSCICAFKNRPSFSGKNNPMFGKRPHNKGKYTSRKKAICQTCGKEYWYYPSSETGTFCSKKCRGLSLRGKKNPNWKGGYSTYKGADWIDIRNIVKQRDNYTCQKCGMAEEESIIEFGCGLHVHHIIPYRIIQKHDIKKLITLCMICHKEEEWIIWKKEELE